MTVEVVVSNRLYVEGNQKGALAKAARARTTWSNPEYGKARAAGRWTGNIPPKLTTFREEPAGGFSVARGSSGALREAAEACGERLRFRDRRVNAPVAPLGPFVVVPGDPDAEMRKYQERAIAAVLEHHQGVITSPTGSGKTTIALKLIHRLKQRALVVVRSKNLMDQWKRCAVENLGIAPRDVRIIQGKNRTAGEHISIAMGQTLWSKGFPLDEFAKQFGIVIGDEAQDLPARTVHAVFDRFPARYRIAVSADYTRKDRKEFLTESVFGPVICEISREEVEADGLTTPVIVRLVPTGFRAPWYEDAPPAERDFVELARQMACSEDRNAILRRVALELRRDDLTPAFVFIARREHAEALAMRYFPADGIPSGLMLGGPAGVQQFREAIDGIKRGTVALAVGTYKAIGQGINVPAVRAGICASPFGRNRQFFGQVRGRTCRAAPGKRAGYLYYLWDEHIFPRVPADLLSWNGGRVEVWNGDEWRPAGKDGEAR